MAPQTEKEETEFKVPETLTLCINNCGLTGNPATNNMCQKCFGATTATVSSSSSSSSSSSATNSAAAVVASIAAAAKTTASSSGGGVPILKRTSRSIVIRSPERVVSSPGVEAVVAEKKTVNRCSGCKRKVGLTGFRCRCGDLFCSEHRYSDRHDCSYDYKTVGREAIARENPVVKAAKIVRV